MGHCRRMSPRRSAGHVAGSCHRPVDEAALTLGPLEWLFRSRRARPAGARLVPAGPTSRALLRAAVRVVRLLGRNPAKVAGLDLVFVNPRAPLGSVRDALTWSPENVRRWIQRGEDDAEASAA